MEKKTTLKVFSLYKDIKKSQRAQASLASYV